MSFLPPIHSSRRMITCSAIDTQVIENGFSLGIPLNIITNVFTELHYGYDITSLKIVTLQFLIGYYSYGKDRYKDALEHYQNPSQISENKQQLYTSILKYPSLYRFSYCVSFYAIGLILCSDNDFIHTIPILGLLYSTEYYKILKENIAILKPFYVSFMWTFATTIMPSVLYEHNYNILSDIGAYVPCFLLLFATTNAADIKDIEEDTYNKIYTLPVEFGEENTWKLIFGSLALSSFLFGIHPHYLDRPIINSLFELQNACLAISFMYLKTQKMTN